MAIIVFTIITSQDGIRGSNHRIAQNPKKIRFIQSKTTKQWTQYNVKNAPVFKTDDWHRYEATGTYVDFEISFPAAWKVHNVIDDQHNEKIAEFMPGIVLTGRNDFYDKIGINNQSPDEFNEEGGYIEYLSKEKLTLDHRTVYRVVEECPAFGGAETIIWYPNVFYIQSKPYTLVISFYQRSNKGYNKKQIHRIIQSFKITKSL